MGMTRLRGWRADDGREGTLLSMWCPACEDIHAVEVSRPGALWQWDGNEEEPTISPSILVGGVQWEEGSPFHKPKHKVAAGLQIACHSYVKAGRWEFLGDCTHSLAGQTVPMVPLPDFMAGADSSSSNNDAEASESDG